VVTTGDAGDGHIHQKKDETVLMFIIVSVGLYNKRQIDRNIDSVDHQTIDDLTHIVLYDQEGKEKNHAAKNIALAIERGNIRDEDIVCLLDLDDCFNTPSALEVVEKAYRSTDILLTYGSYDMLSGRTPRFNGPYKEGEDVRLTPWRATHLKTFKMKLWRYFKKKYPHALLDHEGKYYRTAGDLAIMMPLFEIAGHDRTQFIPEKIYLYNDYNPLNEHKVFKEEQKETEFCIRHLKPCRRMP
jgi:hypothetical protein